MIKNYFKIAWRNIVKSRFNSAVNILGLAVGIAFTMLIAAYVWSELHVNKDLKNADRQYIIQGKWEDPNLGVQFTSLGPLAKAMKDNYPRLVANYHRWDGISSSISRGTNSFREPIAICDSTLFDMYGFKLLYGDATTALNNPFAVVITKQAALKYFGKPDVVGQSITIESFSGTKHDFLITGVLNTMPKNSIVDLIENAPTSFFVATSNLSFFGRNMDWPNDYIVSYVELQKGVTAKELEKPMRRLIRQNAPQSFSKMQPFATSLSEYYLSSNNGLLTKMLYALSGIALFILIMAIINFVNMSVSRSAARMREIGIRKVLGSMKKQLVLQFLAESVIIVLIATVLAFIIYASVENLFGAMLGDPIPSLTSFPVYFAALPFLFVLIVGCITGVYPALVLSSLRSVDSLKGKFSSATNKVWLRKSLVGFQFVTAILAFVGAIVISQQVNLFLHSDLGYNKDYVLSAQLPRDWSPAGVNKMVEIRNQFASLPAVKNVALSYEIPDGNNGNAAPIYKSGADSTQSVPTQSLDADENYLSVYQIPVLAGSNFEGHRLDSAKVLLNETAVRALGWQTAAEAVGQQVKIPGVPISFTVKGVINDFHFAALNEKIAPVIIFNVQFAIIYRYLSFKIMPGNIPATLAALQKKWSAIMPGAPFEYRFMDQTLARLYKAEIRLKKAAYTATVLALIIVLLGILGLVSLSIQKRVKEIGIRKVLGSSVAGIITLFIKEFLALIIVGGLVACPLAYVLMRSWLQSYAYRINITAQPFVISILVLAVITSLLICLQTVKAALANPVKSLRTE